MAEVSIPPSSIPPALRRAVFQSSRSSSRSSMLSNCILNEHDSILSPSSMRSRPATPCGQQHNLDVLEHLTTHASIYGIPEFASDKKLHQQNMSYQGEGTQSAEFLSWRKLHLSKAKLKAASNTSALLAGFAMVIIILLVLLT